MIDPEEIPRRLRMSRVGANLTRVEVAEQLGVNERTLSNWENGTTMIGLDTAIRLCDIYSVGMGELIGDTDLQFALEEIRRTSQLLKEMSDTLERIDKRR